MPVAGGIHSFPLKKVTKASRGSGEGHKAENCGSKAASNQPQELVGLCLPVTVGTTSKFFLWKQTLIRNHHTNSSDQGMKVPKAILLSSVRQEIRRQARREGAWPLAKPQDT